MVNSRPSARRMCWQEGLSLHCTCSGASHRGHTEGLVRGGAHAYEMIAVHEPRVAEILDEVDATGVPGKFMSRVWRKMKRDMAVGDVVYMMEKEDDNEFCKLNVVDSV